MGRSRNWNDLRSPKKNLKYIHCRHLCPYCTLRVSKSSDHWCAFGTMSNFEKRNLRSGHLMWPGGVTFGVIGLSFFQMCQIVGWTAMANLAALRAVAFSLSAKTLRGLISAPRPCAGFVYFVYFVYFVRNHQRVERCGLVRRMNSPVQSV